MFMHTRYSRQQGTTLIELMIYLSISSGIIIGVSSVGMSVLEQRKKAKAINDIRYASTIFESILSNDVREASGVLSPLSLSTSSTTLSLSSIDTSRNPTTYTTNNGNVYRTIGTSSPQALFPTYIQFEDVRFTHFSGVGVDPSVHVEGILSTGRNSLGNSFRHDVQISITATLRAPQP